LVGKINKIMQSKLQRGLTGHSATPHDGQWTCSLGILAA